MENGTQSGREAIDTAINTLDAVSAKTDMSRTDHVVAQNAINTLRRFALAVFTPAKAIKGDSDAEPSPNPSPD